MNVGQMLVELGFRAKPARIGFPCPAIINRHQVATMEGAYGVETRDEVDAYLDLHKSVGERSTTKRSPGNWF